MASTLTDAEALVGAWLRSDVGVAALVGSRVSTDIPAQPTWPLIRVTRVGGAPADSGEDQPTVSVECWADLANRDQALDVAKAVVDAAQGAFDVYQGALGTLLSVTVSSVLTSPDPETARPRVVVDLECVTVP